MQRCDLPRHARKSFRRHEPENTVLYQIVREHVNTFFEIADARSGEGRGLPRYVKNAFLRYLECGILAHGFARVRCPNCGYDTVVAFSCKERGLCPSCEARHMSETAAFLVDRVLPQAPVRQWVLSLPIPVRYILARDAKLLGKALGMFVGEIFRDLRKRAGVRRMREGLEELCRYVLRPPFSQERLRRLPDGRVMYRFRKPWPDGPSPRRSEASASRRREHASGAGAGGVSGETGGAGLPAVARRAKAGAASEGASGAVSRHLGAACEAAPGSACHDMSRAQSRDLSRLVPSGVEGAQPGERAPPCGASRRGASAAAGSP